MGGWVVAGATLGAWIVGLCVGALVGAYYTHRYYKEEMAQARADAKRERDRADNAIDSLSRQMRGEPISLAAVERDAEAFEASLRARDDLKEMYAEETEDVPPE